MFLKRQKICFHETSRNLTTSIMITIDQFYMEVWNFREVYVIDFLIRETLWTQKKKNSFPRFRKVDVHESKNSKLKFM